jgi:hypothetical protein
MTNAEDDGEAASHFIEPYWDKLNIYDDTITYLNDLEMLPFPVRHLLTVWRCDCEICNGGLNQLFFNSTGILAPEAVEGFRAIGLDECSCCIDSAMRQFGELYPRDREARMLLLAVLNAPARSEPNGIHFTASMMNITRLRNGWAMKNSSTNMLVRIPSSDFSFFCRIVRSPPASRILSR